MTTLKTHVRPQMRQKFLQLSSCRLRVLQNYSDIKANRRLAYGILLERRRAGQR